MNYEYRMHDPRIGRFFATDPLEPEYPSNSPFAFSENRVIDKVELEGLESTDTQDKKDSKSSEKPAETFKDGWNETVGKFNTNFFNGVNEFQRKPVESAAGLLKSFVDNTAELVVNCAPGLTEAMGFENKTANAIVGAINTASSIPNMSNKQYGSLAAGTSIFVLEYAATKKLPITAAVEFQVGEYTALKNIAKGTDLHSHHAGQSAVMKKLVKGYDHKTAPTILVSKFGHTIKKPLLGIVSRSTKDIKTVRNLVARDAFELRRVYKAPNEKIIELIKLNKTKYPEHFIKPKR